MTLPIAPYPADPFSDRPRRTWAECLWPTAAVVGITLGVLAVTWESAHAGIGPLILGTAWFWAGLMLWVVTGVLGAAALKWIWGRWWVAVLALLVTGSLAYVTLDDSAARRGLTADPQGWFEDHRDEFDEAARRARVSCCGSTYIGNDLPDSLDHLTARGTLTRESGALFFAQWLGIPDDAGGYWYSPDESPVGNEMFGTSCSQPIDLGQGWWMCGM